MVPHRSVYGAGSHRPPQSGADGDAAGQGKAGQPAVGAGQDQDRHGRPQPAGMAPAAAGGRGRHRPAAQRRGCSGGAHRGPGGADAGPQRHRRHGAAHRPGGLWLCRRAGSGVPPCLHGAAARRQGAAGRLPLRCTAPAGSAAGGSQRSSLPDRPDAGGRAAVLRPGGRDDPGRLRPGGGPPAGHPPRRQELPGPDGGGGEGKDRHPHPEDRLQQGIRLLHRGIQLLPGSGTRPLYPQTDAGQRRALHHAGAEGSGARRAHRQGPRRRAGVRAVLLPARQAGGVRHPRPAGGVPHRPVGYALLLCRRGGEKQLLPSLGGRVRRY